MMAQNVTYRETHLIAFSRQPAVDQERGHANGSQPGIRPDEQRWQRSLQMFYRAGPRYR
jgi:hypothetical protein